MSSLTDTQIETDATETSSAMVALQEDKRISTERVLMDLLRLMGTPAKLEFKDAEDGSLSVALLFEAQIPGVVAGKRSQWLDSLQFLLNKIVNKPGLERRWVNLGAYGHPPPRVPRKEPPAVSANTPPDAALAPMLKAPRNGAVKNGRKASTAPVAVSAPVAPSVSEATWEVAADPVLSAAAKALVEKSAKFGRFYAVFHMDADNRARLVQSAAAVKGSTVKAEGEGRMRRVVFTPEQPKPMPKYVLPDWDEDEDEDASAEE